MAGRKNEDTEPQLMLWFSKTGHLLDEKKRIHGQIKVGSFEGRLVQLLIEQSLSKTELCERLWPNEIPSDLLRTRFHSLIKRVNYKVRDLIIYKDEVYGLSQDVRMKN